MKDTLQISLIGQPNVGKSSLFSRLTGVGVITSNYPGTTVEFDEGTVTRDGVKLHFHDVPGTYSLSANSVDEIVVIDMLRDRENDVVIVVADANNLEPSLVLCFEVIELGIPIVVALNKYDTSVKKIDIDVEKLSKTIDAPVIPVSSRTGEGVNELLDTICDGKMRISGYHVRYDSHSMAYVDELQDMMSEHSQISWGKAIKLLEGLEGFVNDVPDSVRKRLDDMRDEFTEIHGESINVHFARDRYGEAHIIVMDVEKPVERVPTRNEKLSEMTINPSTGIPILIGVILIVFACLIFLGGQLAEWIDQLYDIVVGEALIQFGASIGGELGEALFTGIDQSFRAILGLVIPYIMVFYIMLGILEDTGYLPRAVVLMDKSLHKLGLHGNSFIPMIVGLGCNVPAIMATRTVKSKRERIILASIIIMAVPCSAQLATITGVTGKFAGMVWPLVIFAVLIILGITCGVLLNKKLPYEPSFLATELPDLQRPKLRNILLKMWLRTKDFFIIAVPLLIIGSIIVELLIHYNLLDGIVGPMSWLTTGILGLPAVVIIAFLVGIVRKEMAYGMLLILAGSVPITEFMTPDQFVVFGVVMAIYMPCLATIAAMWKELGGKSTAVVGLSSIVVAVIIGAAFNAVLMAF